MRLWLTAVAARQEDTRRDLPQSLGRAVLAAVYHLNSEVIFIHVVDHGPWLPVTQRTSGAWLWLLRSGLAWLGNLGNREWWGPWPFPFHASLEVD